MRGYDLVEFLLENVWNSPSGLAVLLEVSEKTLMSWCAVQVEDLTKISKANRLNRMYMAVQLAVDLGVRYENMVTFLHEPIDGIYSFGDDGKSLCFVINHEESWPDLFAAVKQSYGNFSRPT